MAPWRYVGGDAPDTWVAGCVPWPAVADVPGNLAPVPVPRERNQAPPTRLYDPRNWCALRNRHAAVLQTARPDGRAAWLDGLDVQLRTSGGGRFTLRELFATMRVNGVRPHPLPEELDGVVAAALVNARSAASGKGASPEEEVVPNPSLGVGEGLFPRIRSWDQATSGAIQGDTVRLVGSYAQLVSDLASMGAGRVRHAFQQDLMWGCVFPSDERDSHLERTGIAVLPPGEILAAMRDDDFARLSPSTAMLTACLALGVRFDATPFNTGGGMPTNHNPTENNEDDVPVGLKSWAELNAGSPSHQVGYLCPSPFGWDGFYWDSTASDWPVGRASASESETTYQKYVTNVWPTAETATDPPASAYMRECARRKCLAVAAFSQGVAEWLARLDAAWSAKDVRIYDAVDTIELGNELNAFWATTNGTGSPTDAEVEAGQREAGRYLALIAGPIRHLLPQMRFRASELSAWHPPQRGASVEWTDDWEFRVAWLRGVIELGIPAEVGWWDDVQSAMARGGRTEEIGAWLGSIAAAGFAWPPEPDGIGGWRLRLGAGDLVHEIGFHWYHGYNADTQGRPDRRAYADAARLASDVQLLQDEVVRPARALGYALGLSCGEIGFSAADPGLPVELDGWRGRYYAGTTPVLQGAMILRWLAMFRALDFRSASVFQVGLEHTTLEKNGSFPSFGSFSTMRLRNDVVAADPPYDRARDMWPRPAWYAFRRFTWLLSRTRTGWVELLHNDRGFTALGLEFAFGLSEGPDGATLRHPWRRAYLFWLDQYADDSEVHPDPDTRRDESGIAWLGLEDPEHHGYELLPVVPSVDGPALPTPDTNGYATPRAVDWTPRNWFGALTGVLEYPRFAPDGLFFGVKGCARDAQQPLCVLTNATFLMGM